MHAWTVGTAALFMITRIWKQPRCLSVGEWVKIVLHALKYYTAIKNEACDNMNKSYTNIVLSKRSHIIKG